MDKKQAEELARVILLPGILSQEEAQREIAVKAARTARDNRSAWFALAGVSIGAAAIYLSGVSIAVGIIFGVIASAVWLYMRRAA